MYNRVIERVTSHDRIFKRFWGRSLAISTKAAQRLPGDVPSAVSSRELMLHTHESITSGLVFAMLVQSRGDGDGEQG